MYGSVAGILELTISLTLYAVNASTYIDSCYQGSTMLQCWRKCR